MEKRNYNTTQKNIRLKEATSLPFLLMNWYSETFTSNFYMDYHKHPQFEIMYCESGKFNFLYKYDNSDESLESVTVTNNCFILVNSGYYHKLSIVNNPTKILNLEVIPVDNIISNEDNNDRLVKQFLLPLKKMFPISSKLENIINLDKDFYVFTDNNNIRETMKEILRKTKDENSNEKIIVISLLINKLFLDIAHCENSIVQKKTGIKYVDFAMRYINSNFMKKITIKEIVKYVGISEAYLQRMFRLQYNKTIHDIINEKRISLAKYLLEQSNANMNIIAESCGFGSREHLIYAFNKIEGCSPSKYRKSITNQSLRYFSQKGEIKLTDNQSND